MRRVEFSARGAKTSRPEAKVEPPKIKQSLFLTLYEECNATESKSKLSQPLKSRLEKLPKHIRREVASMFKDGCTPLFVACRRGHVEIVEYLITVCDVDIEQRGIYDLPDRKNDRWVTPLWCAAMSGKLLVTICLVKHGADINAVSDTGSTAVGTACFMTFFDIVCYLVENGADIHKKNHSGITCLINAVKSVTLCFYLLQCGADINAKDAYDKSALHHAVYEEQFETTKLLLLFGADPYAKSRHGDDPLQIACIKGNEDIFDLFMSKVAYHPERLANAHELLGSAALDKFNNLDTALFHWTVAAEIRSYTRPFLKKLPKLLPRGCYQFAKEFTTKNELEILSSDLDALQNQCFLIYERILGPHHRSTLFRLKYRGAEFVDALMLHRALDLWKRVLEVRVEYDTVLFSDTAATAQYVVHLYLDLKHVSDAQELEGRKCYDELSFEEILETFQLLADALPVAKALLEIQPVYRRQQENFDRILRCITHLIYLLVYTGKTEEQKKTTQSVVRKLLETNPRSAIHGDTLLHLSVSRLNTIRETHLVDDSLLVFPNVKVVELLLDCGAPVNASNKSGSTSLHVAANTYNFTTPIAELLLDRGAHLDKPNVKGESPKSLLLQRNHTGLYMLQYVTLKCLAASAVVRYKIPCKGHIPATLESFLTFHQP